jgi:hypothetical protein
LLIVCLASYHGGPVPWERLLEAAFLCFAMAVALAFAAINEERYRGRS